MAERSRPDPGRWLRVLAGADERLLAQVPLERTRYTGLGGVVLSSATIAGLSMWFFLSQVLDGAHLYAVVPVLIWAFTVLNLDRWLVSTVTGMWQRRVLMLVPRLLMAAVLGLVIAEPLVLRFFQTALEQRVIDDREEARSVLRDTLIRCNPAPPKEPPATGCAGMSLSAVRPEEASVALSTLMAERDRLATRLRQDKAEYKRLKDDATGECRGDDRPGLSGRIGYGPRCLRAYDALEAFARDQRIQENARRLDTLDRRVLDGGGEVATTGGDYKRTVQAAVDRRLAAMPGEDDAIGLLERKRALDALTGEDAFLWSFTWLLRLLMLLVDCLPVLVKLMGGTAVYDRLVEAENRSRERLHRELIETREHAQAGELKQEREEKSEDLRKRREELEVGRRRAEADAKSRIADLINKRTRDFLAQDPPESRLNGRRF
ncbi:DUF4407 domain-containing protein [Nonomuraea sp. NPDC046570]|uniref:DUF4407 domain-containing protein n=1 Tax=Nonomuraea sp. NPDC046570 TaxID=3155255 RepID=UPI0033C80D58